VLASPLLIVVLGRAPEPKYAAAVLRAADALFAVASWHKASGALAPRCLLGWVYMSEGWQCQPLQTSACRP